MIPKQPLAIISLVFLVMACKTTTKPKTTPQTSLVKTELGQHIDSVLTPYVNHLRHLTDNQAGLAIGITKGDTIIYAKTFGYANIETEELADFNTVFHIASVSKPFTAAAIVKLVQDGKLKLSDPLVKYIPEFKMKGEGFQDITIQHVLTHTSGIPRHLSTGDWLAPKTGLKALEENLDNAANFELDFQPGSQFSYSNSAFDILGIVITRASGLYFPDYVKSHILKPLGMNNSHYFKSLDSLPEFWAKPYSYGLTTQEWTPYPYTEKYFPSSGLQSTLLDMCRWGMLHTGNGRLKDAQIFDKQHYEMLISPYQATPWGDKIGLSWFSQSYLEKPIIMHTGNDTGFEAMFYIFPKENMSIVVMANRDFSRTGRIVNAAAEALFYKELKTYQVSARYKFSEAYKGNGLDRAIKLWSSMKSDTTDNYFVEDDDILTIGAVLENGKHWEDTKNILKHYTSQYSKSTYAWRLLGNAYLNLNDTLKAKACYEKTLEINPNYEKGKAALLAIQKN